MLVASKNLGNFKKKIIKLAMKFYNSIAQFFFEISSFAILPKKIKVMKNHEVCHETRLLSFFLNFKLCKSNFSSLNKISIYFRLLRCASYVTTHITKTHIDDDFSSADSSPFECHIAEKWAFPFQIERRKINWFFTLSIYRSTWNYAKSTLILIFMFCAELME